MKRLALVDNIKALLVYLVVLGHLLSLGPSGGSVFWSYMKTAIYSFHMPAFMFLSGLFIKTDSIKNTRGIVRLGTVFLVMSLLEITLRILLGENYRFSILVPLFSAWYLLALIVSRLMLPVAEHISGGLVFSLVAALLIPAFHEGVQAFALSRVVCFFPFLFAGYLIGPEQLASFVETTRQHQLWTTTIVLSSTLCVGSTCVLWKRGTIPFNAFYGVQSYTGMKLSLMQGMAMRCFLMSTAALCTAALLLITPQKRCFMTYVGENSLGVYVLQALLYIVLNTIDTPHVSMLAYGWALAGFSIMFCAIAGMPLISRLLDYPGKMLAERVVR